MKILLFLSFISLSLIGKVHSSEKMLDAKSELKKDIHKENNEDEKHSNHDDHDDEEEHSGHDHHGHGGGKAIGQGKAIIEVDETKGFKLSKEAINSLSIKLKKIEKVNHFVITKESLVTSKNDKGIYRYRDDFFKFVAVRIIREQDEGYLINVNSLARGDEIVVDGVGLLRVSDVYSTDKSEYGHAH